MVNNIALITKYDTALGGVYSGYATSSVLDSGADLVRAGANANEIMIPKVEMSGLADYSRTGGYVAGAITQEWETVAFDYERGRKFNLDAMDEEEGGLNVGSSGQVLMTEQTQLNYLSLMTKYMADYVSPESDAYRYANYAAAAAAAGNSEGGDFETGEAVNAKLVEVMATMTNNRVPTRDRYLFISPMVNALSENVELTKNKAIREKFAGIIEVPEEQFQSGIRLLDGTSLNETGGGYEKAEGATPINFLIIQKDAVLQHIKRLVTKVIDPLANQESDGWLLYFRVYQMAKAHPLRTAGIYANIHEEVISG